MLKDVEDGEEFPPPLLTTGQTEGAEKETEPSYRTENFKRNPQLLTVCFCQSVSGVGSCPGFVC